jgi:hypothetical protein
MCETAASSGSAHTRRQLFVFFDPRSELAGFSVGLVAALLPESVGSFAVSERVPDFGSAVGAAVEPPPEAGGVLSEDSDCESGLSAGPVCAAAGNRPA